MKNLTMVLFVLACLLLPAANVLSQKATHSFGFNAARIGGFPSGAAFLTGGGAYDPESGFLKTGGGFRCLEDINQGPLRGCNAGEGIRWDAVELLPSDEDGPEVQAARNFDRRMLNDAIAGLPAQFREVLILRELEDLSYKNIARIVDVPIGTVMSRLARARRLLAESVRAASSVSGTQVPK